MKWKLILYFLLMASPYYCFPQQTIQQDSMFCLTLTDVNLKSKQRYTFHYLYVSKLSDFYIDYSNEDSLFYNIYRKAVPAANNFKYMFVMNPFIQECINDSSLLDYDYQKSIKYFRNMKLILDDEMEDGKSLHINISDSRRLVISHLFFVKSVFHTIPLRCIRAYKNIKKYYPEDKLPSHTYIFNKFYYVESIELLPSDIDTVAKHVRFSYRPRIRFEWNDSL